MSTLDYVDVPPGAIRLRYSTPKDDPSSEIRPVPRIYTSYPHPSPPPSPTTIQRRTSILSSAADSLASPTLALIPQLLLSSTLPGAAAGTERVQAQVRVRAHHLRAQALHGGRTSWCTCPRGNRYRFRLCLSTSSVSSLSSGRCSGCRTASKRSYYGSAGGYGRRRGWRHMCLSVRSIHSLLSRRTPIILSQASTPACFS